MYGYLTTEEREPQRESESRSAPVRLVLTVEEAAERLGVGRTFMFSLIRRGEVDSVRIGRLRRVPADALQEYVRSLRDEGHVA